MKKIRISAKNRQDIRIFSKIFSNFLPYNSRSKKAWCLEYVAKERKLSKFLPKRPINKMENFSHFFEGMIRAGKKRTIKKMIQEILPRAIEWRMKKGRPILEEEALALSDALKNISIDLEKDILDLKLPKEMPTNTPPPNEVIQAFRNAGVHPLIVEKCEQMFIDGHINESVRKASEVFEHEIQKRSGKDLIGEKLMSTVFSDKNPVIKVNSLATTADNDEQAGYRFIAMGAMRWWRNGTSHGNSDTMPYHVALARIICISSLLHRLDE